MTNEQQKAIEEAAERYIKSIRHHLHFGEEVNVKDDFTEGAKEILNNPENYGLHPKRRFIVAEVRDLLNQLRKEEISFSRFVEILNEPPTDVEPK